MGDEFSKLVDAVKDTLHQLHTQALEIADDGNGVSYGQLAFEATLLCERLDERLSACAKFLATVAGDGEDIGYIQELDRRLSRICDDREDRMRDWAIGARHGE